MTAQAPPSPRRPKDTQPFYLVGGGLLILFVVLAIPVVREWWLWAQLQGETRTAQATITRLDPQARPAEVDEEEINFSGPLDGYSVTYTFDHEGGSVEGRRRIDNATWREYEVGETIPVQYAASDPKISAIAGDNYARQTSTLYLLMPLLGFAALWGSWEWEARRQTRKTARKK